MNKGKANHLADEKSPYLLQHAYNPVEWYPWGEEAFAKARAENKPILVSVGYSTCHWCHVMEKESFSNPEIAEIMNKNLVCIKVDREERPDVDKIYMTAVTAMTGGGGWPLNAFLTPDLKPFYGGTYFPPDERYGRMPWPELVTRIAQAWNDPEGNKKILESAEGLKEHLAQFLAAKMKSGIMDEAALDRALQAFESSYDDRLGGFGAAPKFPMPVYHNFLLHFYTFDRARGESGLKMSLATLRAMANGGLYDHLGGGFHRYSTDAEWHVPHFEKMLYDNAQLAVNYTQAFQITRDPQFESVAKETLDYVLRDMTDAGGAFYSAEDADSLPPELAGKVADEDHSQRSEGAFYLWAKPEILDALGAEAGEIFSFHYGAEPNGNAKSDPQGEFKGKNILYLAHTAEQTAEKFGKSPAQIQQILTDSKAKLVKLRSLRPRPHLDDKVLVSWNGLAISGLAKAYQAFGEERYLAAAQKAARFILENLYDETSGQLYRRWRKGDKKVGGISDDYAFLIQALFDLYEASFDWQWINWAEKLSQELLHSFYDRENGGFFMTSVGHDPNLIVRSKDDFDNVEPSAASVAALSFSKLFQFTDRREFREAADKTLRSFATPLSEQPRALSQMLVALMAELGKPAHMVVLGDPKDSSTQALLQRSVRALFPEEP